MKIFQEIRNLKYESFISVLCWWMVDGMVWYGVLVGSIVSFHSITSFPLSSSNLTFLLDSLTLNGNIYYMYSFVEEEMHALLFSSSTFF